MAYNTIRLKDYTSVIEEATALGAITPGHCVAFDANGDVNVAGADRDGVLAVAVEDICQGGGIDDAYAADDNTRVWIPRSGDIVNAIAGAAIAAGAFISTAAGGEVVTAVAGAVIGEAITAAAAQGDRVQVRIK